MNPIYPTSIPFIPREPATQRGSLFFPGVEQKDPYRGLELVSGCEHEDPSVRDLGAAIQRSQERAAAVTAVAAESSLLAPSKDFVGRLAELIVPRVGTQGGIFVLDEGGNLVYQTSNFWLTEYGLMENVGSHGGVHAGMARYRLLLSGLDLVHLDHLPAIVNLPEQGLILETGAGQDADRILALNMHAQSRRGQLVCHDLPPATARWAGENDRLAGIPYAALPHRSEFLAEPLSTFQGPKIITLKNTLSSMSYGAMLELIKTADRCGAERIVVTQSVGIADNSGFIPAPLNPDSRQLLALWSVNIQERLSRGGLSLQSPSGQLALFIAFHQARHTYRLLLMSLAHQNLSDLGAELHNFRYRGGYVVTVHKDLEPAAAREYAELTSSLDETPPDLNQINSVTMGPFGKLYENDSAVPAGCLRVRSIESVFTVCRGTAPAIPNFSAPNTTVSRSQGGFANILPAPQHVWLTPAHLATLRHFIGQPVPADEISRIDYRMARKIGAEIAFDFVFESLGRNFRTPQIQRYCDTPLQETYRRVFTG